MEPLRSCGLVGVPRFASAQTCPLRTIRSWRMAAGLACLNNMESGGPLVPTTLPHAERGGKWIFESISLRGVRGGEWIRRESNPRPKMCRGHQVRRLPGTSGQVSLGLSRAVNARWSSLPGSSRLHPGRCEPELRLAGFGYFPVRRPVHLMAPGPTARRPWPRSRRSRCCWHLMCWSVTVDRSVRRRLPVCTSVETGADP